MTGQERKRKYGNCRRDKVTAAVCLWMIRRLASHEFRKHAEPDVRGALRASEWTPEAERDLAYFREVASRADPAKVARMMAHADTQLARLSADPGRGPA